MRPSQEPQAVSAGPPEAAWAVPVEWFTLRSLPKGGEIVTTKHNGNYRKTARQIRRQVWEGGGVDGTAESAHPDEPGRI